MKRLWSTRRFVESQNRRQEKLKRRRGWLKTRPRRRAKPWAAEPSAFVETLKAAPSLQLFANTVMTLGLCNRLRELLQRPGTAVHLDFSEVSDFGSDALLLIRAMIESRARQTVISGNLPADPRVAAEFKTTGFFRAFLRPGELPEAQGLMLKKSRTTVLPAVAARMVRFAAQNVPMSPAGQRACYRNLVELMTNTRDHAKSRGRKRKRLRTRPRTWFASVYCRDDVAKFSFLDLGRGILGSSPARNYLQKQKTSLTKYGRTKLLREIFEGKVPSGASPDMKGRGRGLPKMHKDAQDKLKDVRVLTSTVVGSVRNLEFNLTGAGLGGTAFTWQAD